MAGGFFFQARFTFSPGPSPVRVGGEEGGLIW
jgi:hypothetical protein